MGGSAARGLPSHSRSDWIPRESRETFIKEGERLGSMKQVPNEAIEILLVEDNEEDVILTQQGLQRGRIANRLHVARDGVEATQFLRREGAFANAPRPDLVLLDLNLPKKHGREVLREIKTDDDLKPIPVVILTTSDSEQDVRESYLRHANSYMTKPVDFTRFVKLIQGLSEYWFVLVQRPPKS